MAVYRARKRLSLRQACIDEFASFEDAVGRACQIGEKAKLRPRQLKWNLAVRSFHERDIRTGIDRERPDADDISGIPSSCPP